MEKNQVAAGTAFVCEIIRNKLKNGLFRCKNSIFPCCAPFMFLRRQSENQPGRDYIAASLLSVLSKLSRSLILSNTNRPIRCLTLVSTQVKVTVWTLQFLGFCSRRFPQSEGLNYFILHTFPNSYCSNSKAFSRSRLSFHSKPLHNHYTGNPKRPCRPPCLQKINTTNHSLLRLHDKIWPLLLQKH